MNVVPFLVETIGSPVVSSKYQYLRC